MLFERSRPSCLHLFQQHRAFRDIQEIYSRVRWNTSPAIEKAARHIAKSLRVPGVTKSQVLSIPSNGRKFDGGWVRPELWDVKKASLEIVSPEINDPVLADYRSNPHSLMMWSPPTPEKGIIAEVVHIKKPFVSSPSIRGKIALVDHFPQIAIPVVKWLTEKGAVAVVSDNLSKIDFDGKDPSLLHAAQYHNYAMSPWKGGPRIPGFSLTRFQGQRLRALLNKNIPVRLKVLADTRLYAGNLPLVTAFIHGESDEEIVLTAHMDEPGASDNASGTAIAMETFRALAALARQRRKPFRRSIRVFFSLELRGLQAYLNRKRHPAKVAAGLDLDMLGYDHSQGNTHLDLISGLPGSPNFLEVMLETLAKQEARRSPPFIVKSSRAVIVNDAHFACFPHSAVMACLEQCPDRTYHTNLDTPEKMSESHIGRIGKIALSSALFLADASPQEARGLARRIYDKAVNLKKISGEKEAFHFAREAWKSLLPWGGDRRNRFPWETVVKQLYKEGAVLPSGLSPYAESAAYFRKLENELADQWGFKISNPHKEMSFRGRSGSRLVPLKVFQGYLGQEDWSEKEAAEWKLKTGIEFSWCPPAWLQAAVDLANGKRTSSQIHQKLMSAGLPISAAKLDQGLRLLEKSGKIEFRPFITKKDIVRSLAKLGICRGDIVLTHLSVSRFGYVEGGAATMIQAILDILGPAGTLFMPVHSLSWIGREPFDPKISPAATGLAANVFLSWPGVQRSLHPTHSVAGLGPAASEMLSGHDHTLPPLSPDSFYGKFAGRKGKILMLSTLEANTTLHAVEYWSGVPFPNMRAHYRKNGKTIETSVKNIPLHIRSFNPVHKAMKKNRYLHTTPLGDSFGYSMRADHLAAQGMKIIGKNPLKVTGKKCRCAFCNHIRKELRIRRKVTIQRPLNPP